MKILIVDDNIAIQEILSEILSVDYDTRSAQSLEDAIETIAEYRPDAILLDSAVGDRNGLDLMDMMLAKGIQPKNVIVLTTGNEAVPKDNPAIVDVIHKPFKSTEVLDRLGELFADVKEKPKRSLFKQLFGKKHEVEVSEEKMDIEFGKSYLFIENGDDNAYMAAKLLKGQGCDLMIVTSGRIKAAIERMDDDSMKVVALSSKDGPDYIGPDMIGSLMGSMNEFIDRSPKPAVMIDDLDLLIEKNDLNHTLTLLHQVINDCSERKMTLIASTRSDNMTEKDRELLMHSMEIRVFE